MADWKADLDALIDETMAFAKRAHPETHMPRTIIKPSRMSSVNWLSSEREEIAQRVANFKAHQQRFMSEREDYATSIWKRIQKEESRAT